VKSLYYLDLDALPLDRLQHRLEEGDVLPGRKILLEDIPERFATLKSLGIQSIGSLIAVLETKVKTRDFAQQSGLPLDYLVILGREVRSYIPKLVYLRDIPGIDPAHVERLAAVGIKHSKHLFDRGQTIDEREALSEQSGVPCAALLELVQLADLARIGGLGPAFVRLFHEAGAENVERLAQWSPEALWDRAHDVNKARRYTRVVPGLHDVESYVAKAGELPKAIEYQP
jgi:predicted flap endonuclease-1-like 5' DNA nuclease